MATNKRLIKSNDEGGGVAASFNTVLWDGTGSSQSITGVGFNPEFIITKNRDLAVGANVFDVIRDNFTLYTSLTNAEDDFSGSIDISSANTDGFDLIGESSSFNSNGKRYVAWCWKAGGAAVTNTDGTITSQVSANTEAGFSIVSLTIPSDNTQSVGHGLNTAPSVIIMKARDAANTWLNYHSSVGLNKYLSLNSTAGEASYTGIWSDVNSSTFTTLYHSTIGSPTRDVIAYCFAEVAGFSKFGSYTGTGSAGNTVTLGFEPAFLLIKRTDVAGNSWIIADNKRDTTNPIELFLAADTSQVEFPLTNGIDFNPNDFTLDSTNGSVNASGGTYIYMAFANQF